MSEKKKQTRRAISVSLKTYDRIRAIAEERCVSMSGIIEAIITDGIGGKP